MLLNELITLMLLATIPAGLSYLLDFCLGHPGDEADDNGHGGVNPKAILFKWTFFLSERRFLQSPQYNGFYSDYITRRNNTTDVLVKQLLKDQYEKGVVDYGRKLFSWEMATGMCIFCTNVWISLICGLLFTFFFSSHVIFIPIIIIIFSHGITRKLKTR